MPILSVFEAFSTLHDIAIPLAVAVLMLSSAAGMVLSGGAKEKGRAAALVTIACIFACAAAISFVASESGLSMAAPGFFIW